MTVTVVDAFAERPFTGNPAAVCVLEAVPPDEWMRGLAAEMNLAETAFVVRPTAPDGAFGLRWLTPTVEVDLCGHATLAAAHVLFETGALENRTVGEANVARFDTRSGRLTVSRLEDGVYTMDFPATPPAPADLEGVAEVFGVEPAWTGRTPFDQFVVLEDEAAVRALAPSMTAVEELGSRGIILTAPADTDSPYDVASRFFAPGSGVPEDPVTGSAHCAIGPYWSGRLGLEAVRCYQASRRGGHVEVAVRDDRVDLTGRAVTVYRAALTPAARPDA